VDRRAELLAFVKAQGASLLAVAIDWATAATVIALGGHYVVGSISGNTLGAITEFNVKRYWAFDATSQSVGRQAARYAVTSVISAGFNALGSFLLVHFLGVPKLPAVLLAGTLGGVCWTYPMHRFWVFRPQR
jgi:putative flippase GtrA